MPTKKCTRCGEEKDLKDFGPLKRNKDGLEYHCRKCGAAARKAYRPPPVAGTPRDRRRTSSKSRRADTTLRFGADVAAAVERAENAPDDDFSYL